MKTIIALAAFLALTALCGSPARAASCYICSCNSTYNMCQINCSGNTDAVSLQSCSFSCDKSYSTCLDAAYAAMSADEKANQATLDTAASSSSN